MKGMLLTGALLLSGCGLLGPTPECDSNPAYPGSELTCGDAVAAARNALPVDHPAIERIQFLYGSATPHTHQLARPDDEQPVEGYVVFTFDGADRVQVPVFWRAGEITTAAPAEY